MLSLEEAQQRILSDLEALGAESVDLLEAAGRVAVESVRATQSLPAFDNSAMDGYAVRAEDTADASSSAPRRLTVVDTVGAGSLPSRRVEASQAARIFTGAVMPEGADSVVMQEDTERDGDAVLVLECAAKGQHVRREGEDVDTGQVVLEAGAEVRAGELALLAAQGRSWLRVHRRPRVAILPTGDELVELDQEPGPGQVSNTNSLSLAAQVLEAGGIPIRVPPAPDQLDRLQASLCEAAASADLIVTSGGVSVGDYDLVRSVLDRTGSINFWRVAIKPGKPLAYGRLHGQPLIGLPGNPVSSFVCFELFVRPALRKLEGHASLLRLRMRARSSRTVSRNAKRREFLRAALERREGELWVEPTAKQGSGHLSSMVGVEALMDIASGSDEVRAGQQVDVWVLDPDCLAMSRS